MFSHICAQWIIYSRVNSSFILAKVSNSFDAAVAQTSNLISKTYLSNCELIPWQINIHQIQYRRVVREENYNSTAYHVDISRAGYENTSFFKPMKTLQFGVYLHLTRVNTIYAMHKHGFTYLTNIFVKC